MLMGAMFQRNINLFRGKRFYYKALVFHIFFPWMQEFTWTCFAKQNLEKKNTTKLLGTDEEKEFFTHRPLWTIKDAPNWYSLI